MDRSGTTRGGRTYAAALFPLSTTCMVAGTAALALALLLSVWQNHATHDIPAFGTAIVAAILCGSRTIRLSRVATVSVGFVVVFGTLIHLGLPEACVVAAISGLAAALVSPERHRRSPLVLVFAFSSIVVTAWVAGQVFLLTGGRAGAAEFWPLGLPAIFSTAAYQLVNCFLVAWVASTQDRQSLRAIFVKHVARSAPAYYTGAGWAVLVHLAWQLSGPWVLFAAAPPLYSLHIALARWARATRGD